MLVATFTSGSAALRAWMAGTVPKWDASAPQRHSTQGEFTLSSGQNRQTQITLSLGVGQVQPISVEAFEALSQPFVISLDVISELSEIDLYPQLGKPVLIESKLDNIHQRYFHGILIDGRTIEGPHEEGFAYRLTLAPHAHLHEQGRNYRIFQDKDVLSIIKLVLDACKIDYDVKASKPTPQRTYCVQYCESDFAFVSRLMEQYGLYYYYRHEQDKHVLVICDDKSSHEKLPKHEFEYNPAVEFAPAADSDGRDLSKVGNYVFDWAEHVSTGGEHQVTLRDYDFIKSTDKVEGVSTKENKHKGQNIEIFSWPARTFDKAVGKNMAEFQLDARRATRVRFDGSSYFTGIQPGYYFDLQKHDAVPRYNRDYLLVSVRTTLSAEIRTSGQQSGGRTLVQFTAIPADVQFRAPAVTPVPVVKGLESAIVTAPSDMPDEEIHTDEWGRVLVNFFWDHKPEQDRKTTSCWLRVSQTGGLGNIILPRVGHEVLVDFLDGDPDRPIVVGRVFNSTHKPVYALPANKTRAVWRTQTYKHADDSNIEDAEGLDTKDPRANELRFEDLAGKEEVFIHAQRDMTTRVRRSETHHVGKDSETKVFKNRVKYVGVDEKHEIKGKQTEEITGNRSITVKSSDKLEVTEKIEIKAGQEILIHVGASSIKMTTSKIEIKSSVISVEATGQLTAKGTQANFEAVALAVLKGAMVNIN